MCGSDPSVPSEEQVEIVRNSDVLVDVHDAGLSHMLWLKPGSVVVEILPRNIGHKGFRNLASILGHGYFSAHAAQPEVTGLEEAYEGEALRK
jgi:protein O-GlcNAc transferase